MKRCLVSFSREYKLIIEGEDPWDAFRRAEKLTNEEIERYCIPTVHYHAAVAVSDDVPGFEPFTFEDFQGVPFEDDK